MVNNFFNALADEVQFGNCCENSETGKVRASQFPGFSLYWRGLEAKCNILEGQTDKAKEPVMLLQPLGPRSAAAWPSRLGLLERRPGAPWLPDPARGQATSPEERLRSACQQ